jgi:hypothetical protein
VVLPFLAGHTVPLPRIHANFRERIKEKLRVNSFNSRLKFLHGNYPPVKNGRANMINPESHGEKEADHLVWLESINQMVRL